MKFTPDELLAKLPLPANERWPDGVRDVEAFAKDGVRLVLFAPREVDRQTAHDDDDEFYFVIRGSAEFVMNGRQQSVGPGDALFVPAGAEHRFDLLSEDFATWAVFF